MSARDLLSSWLDAQLPDVARAWLDERRRELTKDYTDRALHITLGLIPRRIGKADLALDGNSRERARSARSGWDPTDWSLADAARVLVLIETATAGNQPFAERFKDLCSTADLGESVALYRGLALYPDPALLEAQAAEGLRTNIRSVFEAVAHRNPYPCEFFSDDRWNQMVLKALFVGARLDPIQGLDARANTELAQIMCDYAHERWAAGRRVAPELWRCVGPFATGTMLDDLSRALASDNHVEAAAAALALTAAPGDDAKTLLESRPALVRDIGEGIVTWHNIADQAD